MAAKKKKNKSRKPEVISDNLLPQNITAVGQLGHQEKTVYILQSVYKEIHKFTKGKTEFESGGVLLGNVIEAFGKTNVLIRGFVEAKYSEATPTTLKFTHQSWEYIHKEAEKRFPKQKIVGWIHTHPDFGIFLSDYDKFIHDNFFQGEEQVAYVVDPIQQQEGFYCRINGHLETLSGFYLFDKIGVRLSEVSENADTSKTDVVASSDSKFKNVVIGILAACTVLLLAVCIILTGRMQKLKKDYYSLVETYNVNVLALTEHISALTDEIDALKSRIAEIEIPQQEEPEDAVPETDSAYVNAAP